MIKVKEPAIKKDSGKVVKGKPKDHHSDIPAQGQHMFILTNGKLVNRKQAGKVAVKAKQTTKTKGRNLHTSGLEK